MNEEMQLAWLEISDMLGEPTREELDVFMRTWQRAVQATRKALAEQPAPMIRGDIRDGLVDDEPALAEQPAQQEPVAYIRVSKTGHVMACAKTGDFYKLPDKTLLYTSPPAQRTWVGLSEEDREQHRDDWHSNIHDKEFRAIEAKLKEKNT